MLDGSPAIYVPLDEERAINDWITETEPLDMAAYSFPLATLFTRKTVNLYAICFCGLHRVVHYRISVQNRLSPAAGR